MNICLILWRLFDFFFWSEFWDLYQSLSHLWLMKCVDMFRGLLRYNIFSGYHIEMQNIKKVLSKQMLETKEA